MSENKIISSIYKKIEAQQAKGLKKYGKEVHTDSHSLREWLQHALEETLDKAVYLEAAIQKIDEVEAQEMKYYEIYAPHYALIAAKSKEAAIEIYQKNNFEVGEDFNETVSEVKFSYAFEKCIESMMKSNPELSFMKASQSFKKRENGFLLIDWRLA
ncbi:hypothetical protein MOD76_19920 [Bacillus spizizenii]|nr:hypothetical protein [Bacillus spizizenii]MCY8907094.1 hypothetical protein [Bacillus spizizenii]